MRGLHTLLRPHRVPLVPSLSVALFTGVFLLFQPFLLLPFPGQLLFLCQVVSQAPPPPSLVWPETAPSCSSHIPASSPYTILVRNHFCACVPGQSGQGPCLSVVELSLYLPHGRHSMDPRMERHMNAQIYRKNTSHGASVLALMCCVTLYKLPPFSGLQVPCRSVH